MKFSERIGKVGPLELQKEGISENLKNSLWNVFLECVVGHKENRMHSERHFNERSKFFRALWIDFFKLPIDTLELRYGQVNSTLAVRKVRNWFFSADWYLVFDLIEYSVNFDSNIYSEIFNSYLEKELSAYRIVQGKITELTSKNEIEELESAVNIEDRFSPVGMHLNRALELFSDRINPDYRNSIKESISSVEAMCKIILDNEKTTLGKALIEIEKNHHIPKSLKTAFSILYGYTSDEGGIRHSLLQSDNEVKSEEARFMLIICSAFINYLKMKI